MNLFRRKQHSALDNEMVNDDPFTDGRTDENGESEKEKRGGDRYGMFDEDEADGMDTDGDHEGGDYAEQMGLFDEDSYTKAKKKKKKKSKKKKKKKKKETDWEAGEDPLANFNPHVPNVATAMSFESDDTLARMRDTRRQVARYATVEDDVAAATGGDDKYTGIDGNDDVDSMESEPAQWRSWDVDDADEDEPEEALFDLQPEEYGLESPMNEPQKSKHRLSRFSPQNQRKRKQRIAEKKREQRKKIASVNAAFQKRREKLAEVPIVLEFERASSMSEEKHTSKKTISSAVDNEEWIAFGSGGDSDVVPDLITQPKGKHRIPMVFSDTSSLTDPLASKSHRVYQPFPVVPNNGQKKAQIVPTEVSAQARKHSLFGEFSGSSELAGTTADLGTMPSMKSRRGLQKSASEKSSRKDAETSTLGIMRSSLLRSPSRGSGIMSDDEGTKKKKRWSFLSGGRSTDDLRTKPSEDKTKVSLISKAQSKASSKAMSRTSKISSKPPLSKASKAGSVAGSRASSKDPSDAGSRGEPSETGSAKASVPSIAKTKSVASKIIQVPSRESKMVQVPSSAESRQSTLDVEVARSNLSVHESVHPPHTQEAFTQTGSRSLASPTPTSPVPKTQEMFTQTGSRSLASRSGEHPEVVTKDSTSEIRKVTSNESRAMSKSSSRSRIASPPMSPQLEANMATPTTKNARKNNLRSGDDMADDDRENSAALSNLQRKDLSPVPSSPLSKTDSKVPSSPLSKTDSKLGSPIPKFDGRLGPPVPTEFDGKLGSPVPTVTSSKQSQLGSPVPTVASNKIGVGSSNPSGANSQFQLHLPSMEVSTQPSGSMCVPSHGRPSSIGHGLAMLTETQKNIMYSKSLVSETNSVSTVSATSPRTPLDHKDNFEVTLQSHLAPGLKSPATTHLAPGLKSPATTPKSPGKGKKGKRKSRPMSPEINTKKSQMVELDEFDVPIKVPEDAQLVQCLKFYQCGSAANFARIAIAATDWTSTRTKAITVDKVETLQLGLKGGKHRMHDPITTERMREEITEPVTPKVELVLQDGFGAPPKSFNSMLGSDDEDEESTIVAPELVRNRRSFVRSVSGLHLQLDEDSETRRQREAMQRTSNLASHDARESIPISLIEIPSKGDLGDKKEEQEEEQKEEIREAPPPPVVERQQHRLPPGIEPIYPHGSFANPSDDSKHQHSRYSPVVVETVSTRESESGKNSGSRRSRIGNFLSRFARRNKRAGSDDPSQEDVVTSE